MSSASVAPPSETFASIIWLRAIASLLVVWFHLVAVFCNAHGIAWAPLVLLDTYVTNPLGIVANFSVFAVNVFFVISGFVVTHAALRETRGTFAIKRLLRIYPPLFVSLVVVAVALSAYQASAGLSYPGMPPPTWGAFWHSLPLLNVYFAENSNINPVAWSLVLEMLFYTSVFVALPALKRWPRATLAAQLVLYAVLVLTFPQPREKLAFFAMGYSIIFLMFQGQAYYLWRAGRVGRATFAVTWIGYYVLYVIALRTIHGDYYRANPTLMVNHLAAFALFVVLLRYDARLALPRVVTFCADISYSLYLNHAVLGAVVLTLLYRTTGYEVALLAAVAASVGVAAASYYLIERPSQRLARYLARRTGPPRRGA